MRVVVAVMLILGLSAVLIFVMINHSVTVPINLFGWSPQEDYPVSLVVLGALIVGVLFASIIGIIEGTRLRLRIHHLKGRIRRLEAEVEQLCSALPGAAPGEEVLSEESVL